jgi:hypothetical protein
MTKPIEYRSHGITYLMIILAERVREYNYRSKNSIEDHHKLFPIPQKFIGSNLEATVKQKDGYAPKVPHH